MQSAAALRIPVAVSSNLTPMPRTLAPASDASAYPLADGPSSGSATVTVGEPAKAETPWLLYAGIAVAVGAVGYVIWAKKLKKGRR
jgi:hypothetical protein